MEGRHFVNAMPIKNRPAQTTIEFTFCMIIVLLLLYGTIRAFMWVGVDLAERRMAHDSTLTVPIDEHWTSDADGPLKQLTPDFYATQGMNLVFNGW